MTDPRPYDDRDGWIWFDGELVPWREANVHVLTHALHYASSVFEGQRAYGGEIFKLTEHSERLRKSAAIARLRNPVERRGDRRRLPRGAGRQRPRRRLYAPARLARLGADGRLRRSGPRSTSPSPAGTGAIISARRRSARGCRLDISPWRRPAPYTAPTESKAAGLYMICTLARHAAQAKGYDDALMFDWRGQVAEGDRRQRLLRQRRRAAHADARLLPRRHHPPDRDRPRPPPRHRGARAGDLAGGAGELRADVPDRQRRRGRAGPVGRARGRFEVGDLTLQMRSDYLDLVNRRLANA